MQKHIIERPREAVEAALCKRFSCIKPFEPKVDHTIVDRFKDGTYGTSNAGFALYSNGHNLRGKSGFAPFGLLYHDGEAVFSIGYFQREGEPKDAPGYLILTAPRGRDAEAVAARFIAETMAQDIPISGAYIRFLTLRQYLRVLQDGFLPAKEHPWHPEAPEEDESLVHGVLDLTRLLDGQGNIKNVDGNSKNHRRHFRLQCNRFGNFLERNGLSYTFRELQREDIEAGRGIVTAHFDMLRRRGKDIGSTPEDHENSLTMALLDLENVYARIGFLGEVAVSLFVSERLDAATMALYTTITLRDFPFDARGLSALPMYAYGRLFAGFLEQGITTVHMGGSEHPDLNQMKRRMGATSDPTYWAVKLKDRKS